jgi:hypothetical protein
MTGCVWTRPLVDGGAWSLFACLPEPSRAPIRGVAVDSRGNVIIATSRMGLAGSRGGGVIPQPAQAGVWRFAVDPSCAIGLCGYVVPTSPLIMFAAASQSVEEVTITPEDHLYVAVVDDRLVNQPARLGGLWAGRTDGSPLVSVGFMGADQLRNVVSVDLVTGSSAVDTVITGASLPKAAATDVERTDFEVTRTRVRWDQGPFPTPELLEPLAQTTAVNLDLYGHDGLHWFVDGTSVLGDEQYVVSSVEVLRDGRYWSPARPVCGVRLMGGPCGARRTPRGSTFPKDAPTAARPSRRMTGSRSADLTGAAPDVRQEPRPACTRWPPTSKAIGEVLTTTPDRREATSMVPFGPAGRRRRRCRLGQPTADGARHRRR